MAAVAKPTEAPAGGGSWVRFSPPGSSVVDFSYSPTHVRLSTSRSRFSHKGSGEQTNSIGTKGATAIGEVILERTRVNSTQDFLFWDRLVEYTDLRQDLSCRVETGCQASVLGC